MTIEDEALLAEQIAYYRARAPEYDRVYAEREDLRQLLTEVDGLPITGDVLELACGTGQWTRVLAARARSVTAVDSSPEVLEIARERAAFANVRFAPADVFDWQPPRRYDTVFFAFWLSHVPLSRLGAFWDTVASALAPHGRAVFVDEGPAEVTPEEVASKVRRLDDGRRFRIEKVLHSPDTLTDRLAALGWSADVRPRGDFVVGVARPTPMPTTVP
ncbi:class I SAM-dependent methyltransferase [Streptomyces sp. GQFP]|uniref:class I SAM-dependent methyltransferase n=1 Tax=Streptomyces sp. GQFP TaxID=2907545 RepID=UPI001F264786|nr:class I SAM-dependent methyltransferase [Streptomyces sp. GQFP]UIX31679.1 class I SAM-dependent methyltransferase [Streptomyces sp. GQFP]